MIVQEHYETLPDGRELVRTYSDEHLYIQKVDTFEIYEDAVDIVPAPTYIETDIPIPDPEEGDSDDSN